MVVFISISNIINVIMSAVDRGTYVGIFPFVFELGETSSVVAAS